MSQIKDKLGVIIVLLLSVVMLIPSASSKYVRSYPINLNLSTVLMHGKLYWTDKSGEVPSTIYTFSSENVDTEVFKAGYYMIIAKGGNGANSNNHPGGYGGVVAAIFEYDPAKTIRIALGTSGTTSSFGYNSLETKNYNIVRGGDVGSGTNGGAATMVFIDDGGSDGYYEYTDLALLAAGGGGGNSAVASSTTSYSGGAGGSNIITSIYSNGVSSNTGTVTKYSGSKSATFNCLYGQDGVGASTIVNTGYGNGGEIYNSGFTHEGEYLDDYLNGGGNGGPSNDSSAICGGGGGYIGGCSSDSLGAAGGGSSLVATGLGRVANKEVALTDYVDAMNALIANTAAWPDGLTWPSGVTMNSSGYLCNADGTISDISFVAICYMGTILS